MQAYFQHLQDVINKQEEAAEVKDQLIQVLEDRIEIQSELIMSLQLSLDKVSELYGVLTNVTTLGTKVQGGP